ncbi:ATP-binding protein [Streptomyces sp. GXMU-J15]|jgi:anti-sigma regulatory factor (Ser/Thr protein kinase)|uniref:ATP-binding protein n=1 Tax=Streptomyces fuscus TaxID=3048495 RepID=A0ABT7ITC9_9ACTN|nr:MULTISPECIES: ATP-binding protein [Streptomyces]MDL2075841.1 ATP-binding protein [Streptomyces fuscus]SBT92806.1 Anti-sigma regulatory factor (Ser/Thr protein kinase) [Streptomyces sp. DI166]
MTMAVARSKVTGASDCTLELPCIPESVGRARALVSSVLNAWGVDGDLADDGEVIVSELLANVVEHTETPLAEVTIERQGDRFIRIGVSDQSHTAPQVKTPDDEGESGRGLRLVATLSLRWGYDTHRWGKVTWALIAAQARSSK